MKHRFLWMDELLLCRPQHLIDDDNSALASNEVLSLVTHPANVTVTILNTDLEQYPFCTEIQMNSTAKS